MGSRLANLFGGETQWSGNAKKKVVVDGYDVTVSYVAPGSDDGLWDDVPGEGAIFIEGMANPLELPHPSEIQDSLDDTDWITPSRYNLATSEEAWENALDTGKSDELKTMVIAALGVASVNLMGIMYLASQIA